MRPIKILAVSAVTCAAMAFSTTASAAAGYRIEGRNSDGNRATGDYVYQQSAKCGTQNLFNATVDGGQYGPDPVVQAVWQVCRNNRLEWTSDVIEPYSGGAWGYDWQRVANIRFYICTNDGSFDPPNCVRMTKAS